MTECVNYTLKNGKFLDSLKNAKITPVYNKDHPMEKVNYSPISVFPLLSKIFERVIYNQLGEYIGLFLNKLLCRFRKTHSTQHDLFESLHSWQKELDNSGLIGTILMYLSKAYDCLHHDLVIAKFEAYGLRKNNLKLLLDHLEGRKQRVKIGSSCSFWSNVKRGATQGSILGPLLFNVFVNDLFMFTVKSVILPMATLFIMVQWNYLAF